MVAVLLVVVVLERVQVLVLVLLLLVVLMEDSDLVLEWIRRLEREWRDKSLIHGIVVYYWL